MNKKDKNLLLKESTKQLIEQIKTISDKLAKIKMEHKLGKIKDTSQIKKLRYKIALLKTIIHNKQLIKNSKKGSK